MTTYNLSNIKMKKSRNGYSLQAILLINNVKTCAIEDIGDGSQPDIEVLNRPLFDKLEKEINALPEMIIPAYGGIELKIDTYMFIDLLHYALETKTEFKLLN